MEYEKKKGWFKELNGGQILFIWIMCAITGILCTLATVWIMK